MQANKDKLIDRYLGCLLGLATGDALGTTLEFKRQGSFRPITDMIGGGPFGLDPGQWTDDTSMALCLGMSILKKQGFDTADQMQRYQRWKNDGYLSSTGHCFDIGNTVGAALSRFEQSGNPVSGSTDPSTAGNGSLMRLAPIPMAYFFQPLQAINYAGEMSKTTHGATEAVDACRFYTGLIIGALNGIPKGQLLTPLFHPSTKSWQSGSLIEKINEVAGGSYLDKSPPEIRGTGYVVQSLEASLWAFANTDNFKDGALAAVNLGDDADTTGAIYGQLAGAHYGYSSIPESWRNKLHDQLFIETLSDNLLNYALQNQASKEVITSQRTSESHPLQIDSLDLPGGGRIGMTFCPGKQQPNSATGSWNRDLNIDLHVIREWGAEMIVTLVEQHELESLLVA
ncbi:MAG: ADP-ribosyl-[dinitrogen reductase] hydrolase, partial [Planctomycetota bacterium]